MVDEIEANIEFLNEEVELPSLSFDKVDKWITKVVASYQMKLGDVCYIFCNDEKILAVNQEYLQHDYYTDIITFDYCQEEILSGDLFISLDTVRTNSEKFTVDYTEELLRVIIHGILHLCGLKDKSEKDAKIMREAENRALLIYNSI